MAGSSNRQVDITAKRSGIRDAFVVKHYKYVYIGKNSYYELLVSILTGLLVGRFYDF